MSMDHMILVCGKAAAGKSSSLRNFRVPEGVMYLNCDAGKKPPFPAKFQQATVTNPHQVPESIKHAETMPNIHTIVVDTWTYLNEMYESQFIYGAQDGRAAWGAFAQFVKNLMQEAAAKSTKKIIFLAHTLDKYNESEMLMETAVPVKGAMKNQGLESFFTTVIAAKKMKLKDLAPYICDENKLLVVTPKEEALGFKYVFQTQLTKETVAERIREPMGMWKVEETFIDNDCQLVLDRLDQYYGL